jgi:hypothetical protein
MLGLAGLWLAWFIWPAFALLTGLRHPPPHDDITPLGWPRMVIGLATIALFIGMIVVTPFYSTVR